MTESSPPIPASPPVTESAPAASKPALDSHQALEFAARVLVIAVPILYLFGRVYLEGYWSQLGLQGPTDLALADYLFWGFFALLSGIIDALGMTCTSRLLWVLISGLGLMLFTASVLLLGHWLGQATRSALARVDTRLVDWRQRQGLGWRIAQPVAMVGSGFYGLVGACLLLLLLVVFLIAGAQHAGQVRGREVLANYQAGVFSGKAHPPVMRFRDSDGTVRPALGLTCSSTWCYVYDRNHFVAVPVGSVLQIDSGVVAARKAVPPPAASPTAP
jgi:hypothetical protein